MLLGTAPQRERVFTRPLAGAIGLALFLLGMGLFFYSGRLNSSDEILMAATSASLAEDFSLKFEEEIYGQRWTGYGVGTPLAGVPAYLLERSLRARGAIVAPDFSLFPLTNLFLLALTGVVLASMLEGQRRWAAVGLVVVVSPLFPAAQTFYSEGLGALALAGVVAAAWHGAAEQPRRVLLWLVVGVGVAALAGTLARVALAPFLGLVLVWAWRIGTRREVLLGGAAGIAVGIGITLVQNTILFGGPFRTGYEGQAFTTPLGTGLFGLLLSAERGILVFFPAMLIPLFCWRHLRGRGRSLAVLTLALTVLWLVFHATFWTWHGGWTAGPRFLLPVVGLWVVLLADLLLRQRELEWGHRLAGGGALMWSGLLSYIYLRHSPMDWWNQLWNFHGLENQWLFFPQLSLWQAWLEWVPLADVRATLPGAWDVTLTGLAIIFVALSTYPLLIPFRGYLGTDSLEDRPLFRWPRLPLRPALACAALVALVMAGGLLRGPRGWDVRDFRGEQQEPLSHAISSGQALRLEGWVDYPLGAPMKLSLRADAVYQVAVNHEVVLREEQSRPPHLARVELDPGPGYHFVEVFFSEREPGMVPHLELYWTWGGEGRYLTPAGGEYLHPRPLHFHERFFTQVWRRKELLVAGGMALLLLLIGSRSAAPKLPGA